VAPITFAPLIVVMRWFAKGDPASGLYQRSV
jgi:hypothetical protein